MVLWIWESEFWAPKGWCHGGYGDFKSLNCTGLFENT